MTVRVPGGVSGVGFFKEICQGFCYQESCEAPGRVSSRGFQNDFTRLPFNASLANLEASTKISFLKLLAGFFQIYRKGS